MFDRFAGRRQSGSMPKALVIGGVALLLQGCGVVGGGGAPNATPPRATYLGSIATDDPQATEAARQTLADGGTAADAMAAAGLVLSVSQPARAGLGGGGFCLVQQPDGTSHELDFLPESVPGAAVPVPGMVRGLAALQAQYGHRRWQQAIARATWLAFNGVPAAKALREDMQAAGIAAVPGADGLSVMPQPGVATLYQTLQTAGAQDFYTGGIAASLGAAGVPTAALAAYKPDLTLLAPALSEGHDSIVFSRNPGGRAAAAAWQALSAAPDSAMPSDVARRTAGAADESPAAGTAAVISDASGLTIGCAFTMGRLWGSGQVLRPLGLYASAPLDAGALRSLAAAIVFARADKSVKAAFAAAGSTAAPADLAAIGWSVLATGGLLDQAVALARTKAETEPGFTVPARVEALSCPGGVETKPESCAVVADPRGGGFALDAVTLQSQ